MNDKVSEMPAPEVEAILEGFANMDRFDALTQREKFISDLRAAADFFEQNPKVKVPDFYVLNVYGCDKQEFAEFARTGAEKDYSFGDLFVLRKTMPAGEVRIEFNGQREKVCERVVVGTNVIPEHVIPAQPEMVVPEKVEEVVEWRCHPILGESYLAGGAK